MIELDKYINRENTNSFKWDFRKNIFGVDDVIPMWVADMDFLSPEEVINDLVNRAKHGVYGYTFKPKEYYDSIIEWNEKKHNWKINKNYIVYTPGVVNGLKYCVLSYTKPGDNIIIQTPVYYPFFTVIKENGRNILENQLINNNGYYEIDFNNLEKLLSNNKTKLLILCSPHNPVGRVWTLKELEKIAELCIKHDVLIVSDEIHYDLVFNNYKHIPLASIDKSISDITITFTAPSKTFNVAGLDTSNAIISNRLLRNDFKQTIERYGSNMTNIFGIEGLISCYKNGENWLNELLRYIENNINFVIKYFKERLPKLAINYPQATYLLWLDFRNFGEEKIVKEKLIKEAKVGLEEGSIFGKNGKGFFRMNVGCPISILEKACENIYKTFK